MIRFCSSVTVIERCSGLKLKFVMYVQEYIKQFEIKEMKILSDVKLELLLFNELPFMIFPTIDLPMKVTILHLMTLITC